MQNCQRLSVYILVDLHAETPVNLDIIQIAVVECKNETLNFRNCF
jgi:hypothetical protein